MPQHPDAQIHPHATGAAAKTAAEHDKLVDGAVKFYCGWFCPFVQRTWISLEEKGVPYQLIEINPYHKDPEFLRINPLGLVPALESEGVNLYESTILNEFLEEKFPDKKPLYPTKFEDKAIARIRIDFISKKVLPAFMRTIQAQDSKAQTESRAELVQALKQFASYIDPSKGPFVGGRELGAVDISLAPWGVRQWVIEENRGGPLTVEEVGQTYLDWLKAIEAHPSVAKTNSEREYYRPIYNRYLKDEAQSEAAKAIRAGKAMP